MAQNENEIANKPKSRWQAILEFFSQASPSIISFGLLILGAGSLVYLASSITGSKAVFDTVSKVETARGLITFLVVVATIAIAIILALAAILSGGDQFKERFALGKEIFTTLVGILGTILGFYFGTAVTSQNQNQSVNTQAGQAQALQVQTVHLSKEQIKKGETLNLMTFVSGGKQPYKFTIEFTPNIIGSIKGDVSQEGYILQDITIPEVKVDTEVKFQLNVVDSEGKTVTYNKDGAKKFLVKAQ